MVQTNLFKGIIAYPITPFDAQENVDIPLFKSLTERLVQSGAHGIAPLGSTGVLPYLTEEEKEAVTTAAIQQVAKRIPVLVGVSHLTTAGAIRHARFAEKAGADAVMILPMSYWKLTENEIFRHYEKIANSISLPIMAYNNPATGGIDMSPALLKRLLQIPNITMVKESTGDIQRMFTLRKELGEAVAFYNGSNPLALAAFTAGARGWCTAAYNLIPGLNNRLFEAFSRQDMTTARDVFYQQLELLQFIVAKGLPVAIQAGLKIQGIESGYLRSPLQPLSAADYQKLGEILAQLN
ncbi:dihydrodipicolinate synthase family protein [Chitinophaga eiseniae]|uniref:Dihydrodipicolinate synthase family protein n=1 Tax=Chitinophaga eiseniae TaxID=634771 RepID=A0A847SW82_9BACT|nr:dihydrodipicolinate synthase family protein [Chitinophaga eiseniae]NLR82586.1 dihydrodipicolinate synthase family protein [Chitinophaga eiseniae]